MNFREEYHKKQCTAEHAVNLIHPKCAISFGMAVSQPPALLKAIADRAKNGGFDELKIYYLHAEKHANDTILNYDLMDSIKPHPFSIGIKERELIQQGLKEDRKVVFYVPNTFSDVPRFIKESIELDTFIITTSPMDKHGFFSFGTNNDYSMVAARNCKHLIIEVNKNMPRVFGDSQLHISEVSAIVENDTPIIEMPPRKSKPEDITIADYIHELVPDGATLQIGVGGVPDAVCEKLIDKNDMGIHSELLTPGMMKLIKNGNINGCRKNLQKHKHVYTLAFGTKELYDFMNDNPSMTSYSVDYVNNPTIIAQNDNVISICGILEIDLMGQVNAEFMHGHQFGGPGGQNDFVRGAYKSKGGKSFIAFESTAKNKTITKIVPKLNGVVTDLRIDTQYVVTEFGCVNLKGLSSSERARVLISLAHPDFRDELTSYAKENAMI
ncbi:MAG: acetyl-CoA hydrolase/transferase family protein [Bacteroidales bacterium]